MSIFLNMEDFDTNGDGAELAVAENTAEVAAEVNAVEPEAAELSAGFVAVEDAVAEAEGLEAVADRVAESIEGGEGLTEGEADVVEMAVEQAFRRLRMSRGAELRALTVENFGSGNSRLASSKLVFEGIGETLKKIWEKIKAAIKGLWQRVLDFFSRSTANLDAVEKEALAIRQRISAVTGSAKGDVTSGSVLSAFSVNGKCTLTEVKLVIENTANLVKMTLGAMDRADDIAGKLSALASDPSKYRHAEISGIYESIAPTKDKGVKKSKGKGPKTDVFDFGPFYRGQHLRYQVTLPSDVVAKKGEDGKYSMGGNMASLEVNGGLSMDVVGQSKEPAKSIKALSVGDMNSLMGEVDGLVEEVRKFRKEESKIKATSDALTKISDAALNYVSTKLDNKADDTNVARDRLVLAQVRTLITAQNSIGGRLAANTAGWSLSCAKAAFSLIDASIKLHDKKKD